MNPNDRAQAHDVEIRSIEEADAEPCAKMMQASEPWVTLGTGYQALLDMMRNPARDRFIAIVSGKPAGFVVVNMAAPLSGYIQTICVASDVRAKGIGRLLMEHAEARIFCDSPNVFLFVSDFNAPARAFYERLGYRQAGELPDFLIAGRSEVLMRKTRGPIRGYANNVPCKNIP